MRHARSIVLALVAALLCAVVSSGARGIAGQTPAPAGQVDLASVEMGGRVESVTDEYPPSGAAENVIAKTRYPGWSSGQQKFPQEFVFSFFSRQSALVASVAVNPWTSLEYGNAKDVEVWTSTLSPTDGFIKAAAATLKNEDALQPIAFTPVEAKFVKLRVLSSYAANTFHPTVMSRVRIFEGQRPGYASILARNPDLAALAKGVIPTAPVTAAGPATPAGGQNECAAPIDPRPSRYPQSQNVLMVVGSAGVQRPYLTDAFETARARYQSRLPGVKFFPTTPDVLAPAALISAPLIDTVLLGQVCDTSVLSKDFKQALIAWVAEGHKLIIQDSDACGASPDYSFLPYRIKTVNPTAAGARGEAGVLEDSRLASSNKLQTSFIDSKAWKEGPNDLGDTGVVAEYDAHWCGAMWAKNRLQKNGFALAYAHYGRGLIIYDGFDYDQFSNDVYRKLIAQEMLLPFDADYLPCSSPVGGFTLATDNTLKSQPMAANKTYTYPLSVLGNFGYAGRVTLATSVSPADPAVTATLAATVADLTKVDEAATTLTVTTGPTASLKDKTITVRGRDATGATNLICLALPERKTGSISVVSLLRADPAAKQPPKPPTKNIEIILDASGSMKALLGKQTRWATAQAVLKDVISKLPKDFSVGLRAYGHRLPSTNPGTCQDTALVYPVSPLDGSHPGNLLRAAAALAPRGETPLVHSILQAPADLKSLGGGMVILITDGEESCKGDFAAAAKTLADSGLNLTLNIVGFALKNPPAQAKLSGLAESTGGHYYGASSGDALARAILLAAVDRLPYRVLDAAGKEVARGEAGVDGRHELAPGTYTVVITAADSDVRTPVTVAIGQDIQLKASIKGDKLVIEK